LGPSGVVEIAAAAGVELLALSDHDTVAGVDEAIASGVAAGVTIVPAVELSAIQGQREDLHILGYGIDHHDDALGLALEQFKADREARAQRMAAALTELGFRLDEDVLACKRRSGGSIGRPHLASAVLAERRNAGRLAKEGLEREDRFLRAYLLPGKPGYRARTRPSVPEAIDVIHRAGGVAVWAHPFWDIEDPVEVLDMLSLFANFDLDGVEAFYVTHDLKQARLLDDAGRRLGLLSTGSSDFHGPDHPIFSRFRAFSTHGRGPRLGTIAETAARA
jgi:predicted metal-dependent phosphoesterase TrpH